MLSFQLKRESTAVCKEFWIVCRFYLNEYMIGFKEATLIESDQAQVITVVICQAFDNMPQRQDNAFHMDDTHVRDDMFSCATCSVGDL